MIYIPSGLKCKNDKYYFIVDIKNNIHVYSRETQSYLDCFYVENIDDKNLKSICDEYS